MKIELNEDQVEFLRSHMEYSGGEYFSARTNMLAEQILAKLMICEFCGGTGETTEDGIDSSGNIEKGVETRKCICQLKEE